MTGSCACIMCQRAPGSLRAPNRYYCDRCWNAGRPIPEVVGPIVVGPLTATCLGGGRWRVDNALLPASGYVTYAESVDALRVKLAASAAGWARRADLGKVREPESMGAAKAARGRRASQLRSAARRAGENRLRKAFDE